MIDVFVFGSMGLVLGILAGLLPGLGTGSLMGAMFVILMSTAPINVLIFYLGVLTSAQYFGSVSSIITGVPGDTSAIPSSIWGHKLAQQGKGENLLFDTAFYSLLSGLISFVLFLLMVTLGLYWAKSLSTIVQTILLLIAVICIISFSQNKLTVNALLAALGLGLATIGYSSNFQTYFFVESNSMFRQGIPWLPVLAGLLVIPSVSSPIIKSQLSPSPAIISIATTLKNYIVAIRGAVIGFILGTVPGLSYNLSSLMAAKLEEKLSNDSFKIVVSSESANNAGAVSTLLPLFILGIPITASESIVLAIITTNTTLQSIPDIFKNNLIIFSTYFIIINLLLFVAAWKFATSISTVVFKYQRLLAIFSVLLVVGSTCWLGYYQGNLLVTVITLILSTLIGIYFKKIDWVPIIFIMVMQPFLESTAAKLIQLYL